MPVRPRHAAKRAAVLVLGLLILWAALAYVVLPLAFRHYEHQAGVEGLPMVTQTADGMEGDPVNTGIVGTREELVGAMHAAGWFPADPVTLETSIGIVGSVVLDRPDPDAPVSPLFLLGRRQDLAFEQPLGTSADRRRHVRFWQVMDQGQEGRPVWLGAATLDSGVGLSHYTGAVTHAIAPDVDATRNALAADLARTGRVLQTYELSGIGPTLFARNGEGDRYRTDGEVRFSVLAAPGQTGTDPPPELASPPLVNLKNTLWPRLDGAAAAFDPE